MLFLDFSRNGRAKLCVLRLDIIQGVVIKVSFLILLLHFIKFTSLEREKKGAFCDIKIIFPVNNFLNYIKLTFLFPISNLYNIIIFTKYRKDKYFMLVNASQEWSNSREFWRHTHGTVQSDMIFAKKCIHTLWDKMSEIRIPKTNRRISSI